MGPTSLILHSLASLHKHQNWMFSFSFSVLFFKLLERLYLYSTRTKIKVEWIWTSTRNSLVAITLKRLWLRFWYRRKWQGKINTARKYFYFSDDIWYHNHSLGMYPEGLSDLHSNDSQTTRINAGPSIKEQWYCLSLFALMESHKPLDIMQFWRWNFKFQWQTKAFSNVNTAKIKLIFAIVSCNMEIFSAALRHIISRFFFPNP